mgnify:CR=1 FL=1
MKLKNKLILRDNKKAYIILHIRYNMETEKINEKEIITRLARLQTDMNYVREHIEDITLTEDDLESIKEAEKDLREGRVRRL